MNYPGLEDLIKRALQEDIGYTDITTGYLIPYEQQTTGRFYAKSSGIIAGINVCQKVFSCLDAEIEFEKLKNDGEEIAVGDTIAIVSGRTANLLTGERVALNFLQRLSGIATKTREMVEVIKYHKAELVDTRKTTPGLRVLEKYAVSTGGARNHRFGLYDGVMIKDNHIKAVGGIQKAVSQVRSKIPHTLKIEVEVKSIEQLQEALTARADIIMLDNMDLEMLKQAVEIADGKAILEASGGINESNIIEVAKTGVDFISVGALTHSVKSLDISFDII
jgi:nicotinate-nucleotide pyrophosphorylase (carboxylating)